MKILMLGNGFDLYHKLLTHYDDFMLICEYIKNKNHNFEEEKTIYEALSNLAQRNETISEKLLAYEEAYKKTELDIDEYSSLISKLNANCWFDYFLDVKGRDGWVALESQVSEVLGKIRTYDSYGLKCFQHMLNGKGLYYNSDTHHYEHHDLCDEKSDEFIYEQYCEFIDILKLYLKLFVDKLLPDISEQYILKNEFLRKSDWVITFNYTDTYRKLYDAKAKVIHIHGILNEQIIVGVNSDEFDNPGVTDIRFIKYKKYYQRITKHTFKGLDKMLFNMKLRSDQKALYVIGHSLDSADEDLIKVIFDWFDEIKIFYHNDTSLDSLTKNLKKIFGAKELSKMTFSQKIVFQKLPENECLGVNTNDQL